jgi:frataxin-like iron-binding protein CyaY
MQKLRPLLAPFGRRYFGSPGNCCSGGGTVFRERWARASNDFVNLVQTRYENSPEFEDLEVQDELLKVIFSKRRVFVINRQAAKEEIWLSSPVTGPSQFSFDEAAAVWTNKFGRELYRTVKEDMDNVSGVLDT